MNRAIKAVITALLSTTLALSVKCQELKINETTGKYHEENVILVDLAKKDTLFKKTYKWLFTNFPNTGEKGSYIDAVKGKIIAHQFYLPDPNGLWDFTNLRIGFILTCEFKDTRVKYIFTDFYYFSTGDGKVPFDSQKFKRNNVLVRDVMLKSTAENINNIIAELTAYLRSSKTTETR
jgi:hypothetical protein